MAILIDPPVWPAHGQVWSHLISDRSYAELHEFAALLGVPRRGFDFDHYDVPESLYARALSLGAVPVAGRAVVFALQRADLRVRQVDHKRLRPVLRRAYLTEEWGRIAVGLDHADLLGQPGHHASPRATRMAEAWQSLGAQLLTRWNEPHRHYHNEQHLEEVLLALNELETRGETVGLPTLLAAWFHDAVYAGSPADEVDSADLAARSLRSLGVTDDTIDEVHALVRATSPASRPDQQLDTHLLDADLWIFAASPMRYAEYVRGIRAEYASVPAPAFREGRTQILARYLDRPRLYFAEAAQSRWEPRARANVAGELSRLAAEAPEAPPSPSNAEP